MKKIILPLAIFLLGVILFTISFFTSNGKGELDIDIQKAAFIMPAAHQVYSNPNAQNGKYYLFKAKLTNSSDATMEDVQIRYRVPGFIEWTDLDEIGEMFSGQTAVVACYPKFNEEITKKTTESVEKVEIEIAWDGADEDDVIEEEFGIKITNRNDFVYTGIPQEEIAGWADVFDNGALLACFVTPNDPIVKYYTQNIQEKILRGEAASVNKKPEEAVRFMMGIYEATRLAHMVYSGTSGVPKSLDDVSSFSQHNRLPREVITGNTGLCLELSLLYASVMSGAGIDPIIYLVPGHAYPGFRMNGGYYAIESTAINGEGLGGIGTVEQAFEIGQKNLNEFIKYAQMGDPRYNIIDVHELNQAGVTPMALEDDQFLREKVEKTFAEITGSVPSTQQLATTSGGGNSGGGNSGGGGGNDNSDDGRSTSARSPGPMSFAIPGGWSAAKDPYPELPIASFTAISPDMLSNATVFDIKTGNVDEAMSILVYQLSLFGNDVQYQRNGNNLEGFTYSNNGTFMWKGKVSNTSSGVRVVTVGASDMVYNNMQGTLNSIYQSIK